MAGRFQGSSLQVGAGCGGGHRALGRAHACSSLALLFMSTGVKTTRDYRLVTEDAGM